MGELEELLTWEDVEEWMAYLKLKHEAEQKAIEKAKQDAKARTPRGRR